MTPLSSTGPAASFSHRWFCSFATKLVRSEAAQRMCLQAVLEKITVYGLSRSCPLPRRNNHLAIGGCNATRRIQACHAGSHIHINLDLAFLVHLGAQSLCQLVEINVAASRKQRAHYHFFFVPQFH